MIETDVILCSTAEYCERTRNSLYVIVSSSIEFGGGEQLATILQVYKQYNVFSWRLQKPN